MVGFSMTILISFYNHSGSPTTPKPFDSGLGFSLFDRLYSGNLFRFLFLRLLRCFTSPGSPPLRDDTTLLVPGYPIRKPSGQSMLPARRGISLVAASFFASLCQGIHRMPLLTYRNIFGLLYFIRASL